MMGWDWGYGGSVGLAAFGMQVVGMILFALVVAGLVLLVVRALRPAFHAGPAAGPGGRTRALEIVDERFARGEISEEERERLRSRLLGDG